MSVRNTRCELYGAEANNTGAPIGGGIGYNRIVTKGNYTVTDTRSLYAALQMAKSGEVVYIVPEAVIDLSGTSDIILPVGITLAGNRGADGALGPLLYTNELTTMPLFSAAGPGTRISGIRFRGPDDQPRESAYAAPNSDCIQAGYAEVDNCEIYNWSHAGVSCNSGGHVQVHHNYIHHCQRMGLGYCVSISQGTALIQANIFDRYRHAIGCSGFVGCGYEACFNIVFEHAIASAFDMHGGWDWCPGRARRGRQCTPEEMHMAGDWVSIHHNTFKVIDRPAIGIRGVPRKLAEVYGNTFANPAPNMGCRQRNFSGNVYVHDNLYGLERQLIKVYQTPSPLIRNCVKPGMSAPFVCSVNNTMDPIVAISENDAGVCIRLVSPAEGETTQLGKGQVLPIALEVETAGLFEIGSVVLQLDDLVLYAGETPPKPGECVINADILAGTHTLTLFVHEANGGTIQSSARVCVAEA